MFTGFTVCLNINNAWVTNILHERSLTASIELYAGETVCPVMNSYGGPGRALSPNSKMSPLQIGFWFCAKVMVKSENFFSKLYNASPPPPSCKNTSQKRNIWMQHWLYCSMFVYKFALHLSVSWATIMHLFTFVKNETPIFDTRGCLLSFDIYCFAIW